MCFGFCGSGSIGLFWVLGLVVWGWASGLQGGGGGVWGSGLCGFLEASTLEGLKATVRGKPVVSFPFCAKGVLSFSG